MNTNKPTPLEAATIAAIQTFWDGRRAQANKQLEAGRVDAGLRGAVTGGGHLDGIRELIAAIFIRNGIPDSDIRRRKGIELPGYYRPTKQWDLVVVSKGILVAAIELKSQVGPSFGNNFNNRTEEAIGNAVDVWRAYEEGTFGSIKPWLAYAFVLEKAAASTKPVKVKEAVFPSEQIFEGASYADRYGILCDRLVKERLYDAAWFVLSDPQGHSTEPVRGLSLAHLEAAIAGRVAYVKAL
ncbi:MAG: PaeR7I family type II restriction endonuclease [Candidatus Nanopelagicales bacterium]